MNDEFIRWYSTRYGMKPTPQQTDQSVGLWEWAKTRQAEIIKRGRTGIRPKVLNKYLQRRNDYDFKW
jgi:hypothetical protein